MTEPDLTGIWIPNDRFRAEATKFAEYRATERYRVDEVEYKAALAAVLREITSKDALAAGAGGIAALASGHPDLDVLELTDAERELLGKWPAFQSLLNLLGGGQAAVIQASTLRRWASVGSADVASAVEDLLRGGTSEADRVDAFLGQAQEAYRRLFADGQLKAREVPRVAPQLAAILLCLTTPDPVRPVQAVDVRVVGEVLRVSVVARRLGRGPVRGAQRDARRPPRRLEVLGLPS